MVGRWRSKCVSYSAMRPRVRVRRRCWRVRKSVSQRRSGRRVWLVLFWVMNWSAELLLRTVVDCEEAGIFLCESYEFICLFGCGRKWFFHDDWDNSNVLLNTIRTIRTTN